MRIKKCSVLKLRKMVKKKKIIMFGAGENMKSFFRRYSQYNFSERVECIIDNNRERIGEKVDIKGGQVEIKSADELKREDISDFIVVITPNVYQSIFCQIQNACGDKLKNCYLLSEYFYSVEVMFHKLMKLLPLRNYIVLQGKGDTCENAVALGRYIAKNKYLGKYRLIWLSEDKKRSKRGNELSLYRYTLEEERKILPRLIFRYYMTLAKYLVFENMFIEKNREDQISIYLNHGSPSIKNSKGYINLPLDLNCAISPSDYAARQMSELCSINMERLFVCGSPRTDVFFENRDIGILKTQLGIAQYSKCILWVPTLRQHKGGMRNDVKKSNKFGVPVIYTENDFLKLEKELRRRNICLVIKPHPYQNLDYYKIVSGDAIKIMTQEQLSEMQMSMFELLPCFDAMLTDYSSIPFDFMLLDKMIGYTIDDVDDYKLGLVPDYKGLMAGHKIENTEELLEFIDDVSKNADKYAKERNEINLLAHKYPDGENSRRLCEMFF